VPLWSESSSAVYDELSPAEFWIKLKC
jgi:hypothetical protein